MKITCLIENTCLNKNLECEHGLSLFIETENLKILFDMGQSELFYENAVKLGIDISDVDFAILSHGHYDHGGGLKKFLEVNKTAPVYINRFAFEPHFNGTEKYIGLDTNIQNSSRLIFVDDEFTINESCTLFSCNDKERKHYLGSFGLNMKINGQIVPDDFRHEQYLLIEENSKKILISGCSHKGIMDITDWFKPDVLVGGFHFSKIEPGKELSQYADFLDGFDTEFYTCHCTGTSQFNHMKSRMNKLYYLSCGEKIEI